MAMDPVLYHYSGVHTGLLVGAPFSVTELELSCIEAEIRLLRTSYCGPQERLLSEPDEIAIPRERQAEAYVKMGV